MRRAAAAMRAPVLRDGGVPAQAALDVRPAAATARPRAAWQRDWPSRARQPTAAASRARGSCWRSSTEAEDVELEHQRPMWLGLRQELQIVRKENRPGSIDRIEQPLHAGHVAAALQPYAEPARAL